MTTIPAIPGKHRAACEIPMTLPTCQACEEMAAEANYLMGWTHPTHRAPKHSRPYRELPERWQPTGTPTHRRDVSEVAA